MQTTDGGSCEQGLAVPPKKRNLNQSFEPCSDRQTGTWRATWKSKAGWSGPRRRANRRRAARRKADSHSGQFRVVPGAQRRKPNP